MSHFEFFTYSRKCINRALAALYVKDEELQLAKVRVMIVRL